MPLYEYECIACRKHTEKIQKFSDPEITTCPQCGGELKRVISAPAFSMKGGGWFADGYGSAKPAAAPSGEGAPAPAATGPSEKAASAPVAAPTTAPAAASTASSSSDK